MKNNYVFAIDCDEVLRKTLDHMVSLYNEHFHDNKTRDDIKDFNCENSFPEIEPATGMTASKWFFQEHSTEMFLETEPFPHVKEDIDTLRKYGKVIIVTYQKSYQNKIETLQWLEKQGIECDGVCFLKNKTLLRQVDYFIDDNDWNFSGSQAKYGILIDAPYNKEKKLEDIRHASCCEGIERCGSLHEFVTKFVSGVKALEELETKYYDTTLTLKTPFKLEDKDFLYGRPGASVKLTNTIMKGTKPCVAARLNDFWGDAITELNNFKKSIGNGD